MNDYLKLKEMVREKDCYLKIIFGEYDAWAAT